MAYAQKDIIIWACDEEISKGLEIEKFISCVGSGKPARGAEDLECGGKAIWRHITSKVLSKDNAETWCDSPFHRTAHHIVWNRNSWSENYLTAAIWVTDFELILKEHKEVSLVSQTSSLVWAKFTNCNNK